MRIRAYFAAYGNEESVRSVARSFGFASEVKELGIKRPAEHRLREPSRWIWRTERIVINVEDIEQDVEAFLLGLGDRPATWRAAIATGEERCLTLIVEADDAERAPGFALSSKTVAALAAFDASFDVDFVSVLE